MQTVEIRLGPLLADLKAFDRPLTPAEQAYLAQLRYRVASGGTDVWTLLHEAGLPQQDKRVSGDVMFLMTVLAQARAH